MDEANGEYRQQDSPPHTSNGGLQDVPISTAARIPHRQISNVDVVEHKTGVFGASSNLVNAIVGAGIIGIPFAVEQSGLVVGVGLLILVSWMTAKSLRMIVELASYHPKLAGKGVLTFEDLMKIPYGETGKNFLLISMFVFAYGAMVAYLIIIKDSIPTIIGLGDTVLQRNLVMIVTSVLPLSMMKDISQLAYTSLLSVIADTVLILIVVLFSPVGPTVRDAGGFGSVLVNHWINSRVFIGLGVLSTAMACQHSAFLISGSLTNPTPQRWASVALYSLTVAGALSILIGAIGYLGFLEKTEGDILNSLDKDSTYVNAARGLLALTMVFTYPMESFVARHVFGQLFGSGSIEQFRWRLTVGLYVTSLIPALIFNDLGIVLSLTGSLGASTVAYIAPGLVVLGINGHDFVDWVQGKSMDGTAATAGSQGEVELPVVGDASATIQNVPDVGSSFRKPWWWFPLAMPVWIAIANSGARGTDAFLADYNSQATAEATLVIPDRRDYVVACLFIVFGVVAAVCGLATNIFVQINDIFFNP